MTYPLQSLVTDVVPTLIVGKVVLDVTDATMSEKAQKRGGKSSKKKVKVYAKVGSSRSRQNKMVNPFE